MLIFAPLDYLRRIFFAYIIDIRPDPSPPIFKLEEKETLQGLFRCIFRLDSLYKHVKSQMISRSPIHPQSFDSKNLVSCDAKPHLFSLPVLWRMTSRSTTAATPLRSRREKNISAEGSVRGGRRREASRNFFQVKDSDVMQPERWPGDLSQFFASEVLE